MQSEYHGYNGTIIVGDEGLTLKPGVGGVLFGGSKPFAEKFIPFKSIIGVEYQKAFLIWSDFIQLKTQEANPVDRGALGDLIESNVVNFYAGSNKDFEELKQFILGKITAKK